MLQACHVSYQVFTPSGEQLTILQDIDLQLAEGESLAIVGASGSGKSTLLALLAGLIVPTAGSIWVDGVLELSAASEEARARWRLESVGFVFQNFQLIPYLTAWENVALPLWLRREEHARAKSVQALERVGLGGRLGHRASTLSGGEQQRVALARALVVRPRFLFADEPTANLDAGSAALVRDLLFELHAELGNTLVLVTHDEALAQQAMRRVRLAAGRLLK